MSSLQSLISDRLPFVPDLDEASRQALQVRTAEAFGLPVRFRDPLDAGEVPELAVIPAGMFEMGSPEHEFGHREGEGPQHYQQITEIFAIGVLSLIHI